jgi:UDP-N-acetylglucosamine acyltransferase
MNDIHSSAIVSPKAELGDNISIGPYAVIEAGAVIKDGVQISSHVVLGPGAIIGQRVKISPHAVIGTGPQDLKYNNEPTTAEVGEDTILREFVTINRGTKAHGLTKVGARCFLMAYTHVAHDCQVGNNVIMANSANLAGHVEVDDFAILGGILPVHQFVKIGAHSMIGGGFRVHQDVCPFALAADYPLRIVGINSIGLRRRGFSRETIRTLEKTYKILFFSGLNTSQAVGRLQQEIAIIPEVEMVLAFVRRSKRGLVKSRHVRED